MQIPSRCYAEVSGFNNMHNFHEKANGVHMFVHTGVLSESGFSTDLTIKVVGLELNPNMTGCYLIC